jgi:hypothetical protein
MWMPSSGCPAGTSDGMAQPARVVRRMDFMAPPPERPVRSNPRCRDGLARTDFSSWIGHTRSSACCRHLPRHPGACRSPRAGIRARPRPAAPPITGAARPVAGICRSRSCVPPGSGTSKPW